MQSVQGDVDPAMVGEADMDTRWADLDVHAEDVEQWRAKGFGPFDAALAQGDGFTPSIIEHYRRQLRRVARTWARQGLDSAEGLRWHRAGFTAADAVRWRAQGVDVATARIRRDGYDRESTHSGTRRHGNR